MLELSIPGYELNKLVRFTGIGVRIAEKCNKQLCQKKESVTIPLRQSPHMIFSSGGVYL
jgi:hypothetical protein